MAVNKRLLQGAAAAGGLVPSEHFGVVLYEGDGSSSHSINGGKFGAGAYFDGSNGYITTPHISAISGSNANFTVSLWFNLNSLVATNLIQLSGSTSNGTHFTIQVGSNGLLYLDALGSAYNWGGLSAVTANQWHNVVVVNTGATSIAYLNGSAGSTLTHNLTFSGNYSTIGGRFVNGSIFTSDLTKGKIDQVRIFTKALSSSQVSTLYAETAATVESLDPLNVDTTDTLQVLGDSSCVATYRFENDEVDLSGNYDGTGTEIQYAAGRYGQAASFGSNSKVQLPSGSPFNDSDTIKSISAWVKADTTSSRVYPFSIGSSTIEDDFFNFGWIPANNYILLFIRDGSSSNQASHSAPLTADTNWHHIVVQTTGSAIQIFIDGESKSVTSSYSGSASSSSWISYPSYGGSVIGNIGANAALNPVYSNGKIDQLRFFNKALSAAEVTTLYNENPLVASYRFEGNANDDMRAYDGTATNVTYEYGLGFTPDFVWIKGRTSADNNFIFDSTRGDSVTMNTNLQAPQYADTGITSFDTGGFTLGSGAGENRNGDDYVAWCLKANGGTTTTGTGTGGVSSVTHQLNSDAGFCITKFTVPSASGGPTTTHGLDSTPDFIIMKRITAVEQSWWVWHNSFTSGNDYLQLQTTGAKGSSVNVWNGTAPDATKVTLGAWNLQGDDYIMYAFKNVDGFSKFGSYTGTGGNLIVETGFEPAFLMVKRTDAANYDWYILDNKRNPVDYRNTILRANSTDADATVTNGDIDVKFLSNGFAFDDIPTSSGGFNASGGTYIYMAFAADPDTEAPTVANSFSTVTYDGNGGTQSIDGLGFAPNLVWIKQRGGGTWHNIQDTINGATKHLYTNATNALDTTSNGLTSFDSDGFTLGGGNGFNGSGQNMVAWAWKADDNEPTINTEGSIDSLVSANANAGFSIVKYEGNGTSGATIGHGLSAAPDMVIAKGLSGSATSWWVQHTSLTSGYVLELNGTAAEANWTSPYNNTAASSTVVTLGNGDTNRSGETQILYCFHSVSGYSKFGSYTGNGTSQSITGLGFQPDFVLVKSTNATGVWFLWDSVRLSSGDHTGLYANDPRAETVWPSSQFDIVSTGFTVGRINNNDGYDNNNSGVTYIYMAFKIN